jgi:hypothetical protein
MEEVPDLTLSYLAAPYSHPDKKVVEKRMETLCKVDALLMKKGTFTVSPLLKHYIVHHADLPTDWNFWQNYSYALMCAVDQMIVVMIEGWAESVGVQAEIEMAKRFDIPIIYVNEAGEEVEV